MTSSEKLLRDLHTAVNNAGQEGVPIEQIILMLDVMHHDFLHICSLRMMQKQSQGIVPAQSIPAATPIKK